MYVVVKENFVAKWVWCLFSKKILALLHSLQ